MERPGAERVLQNPPGRFVLADLLSAVSSRFSFPIFFVSPRFSAGGWSLFLVHASWYLGCPTLPRLSRRVGVLTSGSGMAVSFGGLSCRRKLPLPTAGALHPGPSISAPA